MLTFGFSTAGHVFSKVLRPLVKHWRAQGYRMIVYLDDGWGIESSYDNCKKLSNIVKHDLLSAGFFINFEKSIWEPTKSLTWLGFIWNLVDFTLEIPKEKLVRFKGDIMSISKTSDRLTARELSRITGKIISFLPSFGNICRIMSRNMLMLIANSNHWDANISLTDEAKFELDFWLRNCDFLPSKSFLTVKSVPDRLIYTDASSFACAGFSVQTCNSVVHKMWTADEASKSSTFRELKAVHITILSLLPDLRNRLVKVYTDNQNVARIINCGSMRQELQNISLNLFDLCLQNSISLEVEWIPRDLNTTADFFSKLFDFNDWSVDDIYFQHFNNIWGPFDCDLFADYNNHKLSKYFSAYWCPGTSGVDALAFNWEGLNCWIVPPIHLVPRALEHLKMCRGRGTLVIPKWTSSCFWPILWSSFSNSFKSFVKASVEYVKPTGFFRLGSDKNSIFSSARLTFNVLVLRLDFR